MNARFALAAAATSLFALAGCAASTHAPAAPSPVVAYAIPARDAETQFADRFESPAYEIHTLYPSIRPLRKNGR